MPGDRSLEYSQYLDLESFNLGENWHRVEDYAGIFQKIVIVVVVVVVVVAWFVTSRVRTLRARGERV